jgi:hypothetical protein
VCGQKKRLLVRILVRILQTSRWWDAGKLETMSQIKLGSALDEHRRALEEAEGLIDELVVPIWNVSESPEEDENEKAMAAADRLLAKLPITTTTQVNQINSNSKPKMLRKGKDLRSVVFKRCIRILSMCVMREAFRYLRGAARFHESKCSALRVTINVHRNFWNRKIDRAFRKWTAMFTVVRERDGDDQVELLCSVFNCCFLPNYNTFLFLFPLVTTEG